MKLKAEKREQLGKSTRLIKSQNKVPAVVFGKGMDSIPLSLDYIEFSKVYDDAGETDIIDVLVNEEVYKVLIKNVQLDPVSDKIIHVELYKPNLTEKIEAQIPVTVIGEEQNELIKSGNAMALLLMQEITVEALPLDLPHEFIVDVSKITELGQGVAIKQLDYDREKVEIPDIDPEELVVRIDEVTIVEEEPEEQVSEEEAIAGVEATQEKPEGEDGEDQGDAEPVSKEDKSE